MELRGSERCPTDEFELRKEMEKQMLKSKVGFVDNTSKEKLKKFLVLDKKVLRFYCVWQSDDSPLPEKREFVLHVSHFYFVILLYTF